MEFKKKNSYRDFIIKFFQKNFSKHFLFLFLKSIFIFWKKFPYIDYT